MSSRITTPRSSRPRIVAAQILRDAVAGYAADPCADRLDGRHQRKAEQHRPAEAVAELRAHLAVGRDAARIVVGRAGDQTRSQTFQKFEWHLCFRLLGIFEPGTNIAPFQNFRDERVDVACLCAMIDERSTDRQMRRR